MNKKRIVTLSLVLFVRFNFLLAQEVCEAKTDTLEDLNSITKCTINKTEKINSSGKKTKELSVKISYSTRYLKKRVKRKTKVTGVGKLNASDVNQLNMKSNVSESLNFENKKKEDMAKLMSKISKEQLKNASVFEDVDQIPLFKSCKATNKKDNLNCFNEKMTSHIQKNFRYPRQAIVDRVQGDVWVRFVIDKDGNVTNLKALMSSDGEILKKEAIRVISKLAPFKPAIKKGKKVLTKYGFPINFSLED